MLLRVIRSVWSPVDGNDWDDSDLRRTLVALILMVALDNLLNGEMSLSISARQGRLVSRQASRGVPGESARRILALSKHVN